VVSVEAHKIQAARAILLCIPKVLMLSVKSPIEPPPEIGRMSASGRISTGIFRALKTGAKNVESASITPDARSMPDAESMATKAGRMETTVLSPFSTPEIKVV